ncbi:MAG TPA: hypothetical protein VNQ79_06595 [Blastocatellia bacterium]|nr:hypothetical protein [Blastocatellia bacterium]
MTHRIPDSILALSGMTSAALMWTSGQVLANLQIVVAILIALGTFYLSFDKWRRERANEQRLRAIEESRASRSATLEALAEEVRNLRQEVSRLRLRSSGSREGEQRGE